MLDVFSHAQSGKQEARENKTVYSPLFSACKFATGRITIKSIRESGWLIKLESWGLMSKQVKVLLVENTTAVAMLMTYLLSSAGCDVVVARTGEKGLEMALKSQFDLIALNRDLSDLDGFHICSELKQRHFSRHTPIVFIAGQPCETDRRHALGLGAADYIARPFEVTDFIFRIVSHAKAKSGPSDFPDELAHANPHGFGNTPQGNQ